MFEGSILHVLVDDRSKYPRFRISDYEGVQWSKLHLSNTSTINKDAHSITIKSSNDKDQNEYIISMNPFRITYTINEEQVMEINTKDLLYFENPKP